MTDTPKYIHAYRVIVERLKAGRYSIGSRLPTESDFALQFNVSRVTIRRALDMLVQDGYVERKQGSGYKILTLSPASDTCLTSFTDAMLRAGHEPASRFLALDLYKPSAKATRALPSGLQQCAVTRITRLREVDNEPQMLVMTYVPTDLLRDATAADFPEVGPGQSILRILSARFNLDWSAACEDISPIAADSKLARILKIKSGELLLKQSCSAFDDNGGVVFHEDVFRRGPLSFNLSQQSRTPRHL